jgi:hypothetical protein
MLPRSSVLDDLDPGVATAFDAALATLIDAGAVIVDTPMPVFDRQGEYFRAGGFAGAEAYSIHRRWLDRASEYDPRVGKRIVLGQGFEWFGLCRTDAVAGGLDSRVRIAGGAVRWSVDADGAVHGAVDRRGDSERRGIFPLERTHSTERRVDQFSGRVRGVGAVSPAWRRAGWAVGMRGWDE